MSLKYCKIHTVGEVTFGLVFSPSVKTELIHNLSGQLWSQSQLWISILAEWKLF